MRKIIIKNLVHRGENIIGYAFEKDEELINLLKKLKNVRWTNTHRMWYQTEQDFNLTEAFGVFRGIAFLDYTGLRKPVTKRVVEKKPERVSEKKQLTQEHLDSIAEFERWLRHKRYSNCTVKSYIDSISTFLRYNNDKPISEISNDDLIGFVNGYILKNRYSSSYQNQIVNSMKHFFREVRKSRIEIENIDRPFRESKLPNVLSRKEVKQILEVTRNGKHKTMLSLIYACGLRRGEILKLKPRDVDSERHLLVIRGAKGNRDRVVPISDKTIEMLREYYKTYRPKEWLFEGQKVGEQYSEESLAKVLKMGVERAGIDKPVTLHWLRHSYATHMLESGVDMRYIQVLLGHKSSKTTEIYTHVTEQNIQNIRSPLDDL